MCFELQLCLFELELGAFEFVLLCARFVFGSASFVVGARGFCLSDLKRKALSDEVCALLDHQQLLCVFGEKLEGFKGEGDGVAE